MPSPCLEPVSSVSFKRQKESQTWRGKIWKALARTLLLAGLYFFLTKFVLGESDTGRPYLCTVLSDHYALTTSPVRVGTVNRSVTVKPYRPPIDKGIIC